jgi:hypothetical protein
LKRSERERRGFYKGGNAKRDQGQLDHARTNGHSEHGE